MNIYVKDALLTITPFVEMAIWFLIINALGGFSTQWAPLFAILVLASFMIDAWALKCIRKKFKIMRR